MRFNFNQHYQVSTIEKLFTVLSNNTLSRENLNNISGEMKNIHYGDILTKLPTVLTEDTDISFINLEISVASTSFVKMGDVILANTAEDYTVGKTIEINFISSTLISSGLHTIPLRPIQKFSPGFLGYYFNSFQFKKKLHPLIQGIKVYSISKTVLLGMEIFYPCVDEQTKIANFLMLIDNRIQTQKKIIEDLNCLKNSILNTIFTTNTLNYKLAMMIEQESKRNKNSSIKNILSISSKYGFIKQSEQFEEREIASGNISKYKIINKDIFAYNPARINVGSIAKYNLEEKGIVSPMYICFKVNDSICPEYLNYYFKSNEFKKQMMKRLEGSVRQCLTYESLINIPFNLPNFDVQKKNADIITAFTIKIEFEEQYMNLLKKQKFFLLSKMFI